jgi:hypothetical protein
MDFPEQGSAGFGARLMSDTVCTDMVCTDLSL